jgi:hypothetical protein
MSSKCFYYVFLVQLAITTILSQTVEKNFIDILVENIQEEAKPLYWVERPDPLSYDMYVLSIEWICNY